MSSAKKSAEERARRSEIEREELIAAKATAEKSATAAEEKAKLAKKEARAAKAEVDRLSCQTLLTLETRDAIITKFKASDEYGHAIMPYYNRGREHMLRVAAAYSAPLGDLIKWYQTKFFGEDSRWGHKLVLYSADELVTLHASDGKLGKKAWAPPYPLDNNFRSVIDALVEDPNVSFDADLKLAEFEGQKT